MTLYHGYIPGWLISQGSSLKSFGFSPRVTKNPCNDPSSLRSEFPLMGRYSFVL